MPDTKDDMKVIIFGATGNIGAALVRKALDNGLDVTLFVRNPSKLQRLGPELVGKAKASCRSSQCDNAAQSADAEHVPPIQVIEGDATDQQAVGAAMRGHGAAINTAGLASGSSNAAFRTICKSLLCFVVCCCLRKEIVL